MSKRLIILSLLAITLVGNALGEFAQIPASKDVYFGLGTENEQVYNQTNPLICAVNVTDINGTKVSSYPGVPLIQFDISNLNVTDDDIAILVLKAASIKKSGSDSALIALLSIGSEWDEESDYTTLLVNILPAWNIVKKNDLTQMGSDSDGDRVFAFDVSNKLMDAKARGNSISFLLEAISNSSYEADFFSKESGQGPYLIVMPYPESKADLAQTANQTTTLPPAVASALASLPAPASALTSASALPSNESEAGNASQQAVAAGRQNNEATNKTTGLNAKLSANPNVNQKLTVPLGEGVNLSSRQTAATMLPLKI